MNYFFKLDNELDPRIIKYFIHVKQNIFFIEWIIFSINLKISS